MQRSVDSKFSRRRFLGVAAAAGVASWAETIKSQESQHPTVADLARLDAAPVLDTRFLGAPVKIRSIELLRNGRVYLLRTRSDQGVEAITVPNPTRLAETYPIFL